MKWLTVKEAADAYGVTARTIRRWIKKGMWETKEEQVGPGSPTLFLKVDMAKLDISKNEPAKVDTHQKDSPKKDDPKLDIFQKSEGNSENLTHPGVSKYAKLDISEAVNNVKANNINNKTKVDTPQNYTPKVDIVQFSSTKVDTSKVDTPKLDISENLPAKVDTFQKYQNSIDWIPIDRAEELSGFSRSSLFRLIRNQELYSVVVADKLSKQKTLIEVSGFSREVQLKWKGEVLSSNSALSTVLQSEENEFNSHTQEDRDRAWHKKAVIDEYLKFRTLAKASGESLTKAGKQFEIKLNNREILPNVMKKLGIVSLSIKTIKKWEKSFRDSGNSTYPVSLLENRKGTAGRKKAITKKLEKKIKALATNYRELPATGIYRMIEEELSLSGQEMPIALRTLTLAVNKARKDKTAIAISKGKKAYKDNIRPHVYRINNAMPNDLWESDGHHMNNLVLSPFYAHPKPQMRFLVKPILIVWYDIATGFIASHLLTLTENQNAVRNSLLKGGLKYGFPKEIRIDNGSAYKNINHTPHIWAGKARVNNQVKKAKEMILQGDNGLYANLGIKYNFTIPGNAESKMIEPFWGFCMSMFEKAFPVWIGNKIENRHEELRLTNKRLIKKYGKDIPTWEQYSDLLDQYVDIWNNRKRSVLVNGRGEQMTPWEAFSEEVVVIPSREKTEAIARWKYPQLLMVDRGRINVNGILYSHPSFMALQGRKVAVYYDESNLKEVVIGSEHGELFTEPAKIIYPGLQVGDDMSAYIETKHREKIQKSIYLALENAADPQDYNTLLLQSSEDMLSDQERLQTKQKHTERLSIGRVRRNNRIKQEQIKELEYTDAEFEEISKKAQEIENKSSDTEEITDEFLNEFQKNVRIDEDKNEELNRVLDKLGIQ